MNQGTLMHICYAVYCDKGSSAVYDIVDSINKLEEENASDDLIDFNSCIPCDAETPNYQNNGCLICGQ